jgi:hypothetical protein
MNSMNEWADFWRYQIGVNVLPARGKRPLIPWKEWQNKPIPEDMHNQWKKQGAYSKGIAVFPGKVWHKHERQGLYFIFLDADKQEAITELCTQNGKTMSLDEMALNFLVEQHEDNLQKAHVYFYSPIPFPKKEADSVLGLEVKGLGGHGIANCAGSIHKDGQPWEIIGTTNPITLTADQARDLIEHIDQVCKKYNLEYLEKHYRNLLDSDSYIYQGERHDTLLCIANSLLFRYGDGNSNGNGSVADSLDPRLEQELKDKLEAINQKRCKPSPLPQSELGQIWKDAVAYYAKKKKEGGGGDKSRQTKSNQSHKDDDEKDTASDTDQEESTALRALKLAEDQCDELFHDQFNAPYAAIQVGDHTEILPLKSSRFRNWLYRLYYEFEGDVLSSEIASNIINILKAKAEFEGSTKKLNLRVASIKEESFTIYYDLTDKDWLVIKVTKDGWDVQDAPIIFRRYSNQQPQVYPRKEYSADIFDQFMNLINIKGEDNKLLLKCYIISLFYPEISKPILMLHGEQGSAKSTLQELIRMLVDPSSIRTLTFPRDINELVQKLSHNYIAYFDNVSLIPEWISDQLCRAVTGSGFSKRELYTDDDDIIYNFKRCIGFNGINLGATKADLLDRGIIIELERISREKQRRLEEIWAEFDGIKPELLGYIFDIVVKVLQVKNNGGIAAEIKGLPRMADFAEIAEIISRCMGYDNNKFLDAYYGILTYRSKKQLLQILLELG